jgi:23S rRNA (guanine1835-N2)-methyltransferase
MSQAEQHSALTHFEFAGGSLELQRYPARPGTPLQAWCSADSLLLEYAIASAVPAAQVLVVNDEFGALGLALPGAACWTDSALSQRAITENATRNGVIVPRVIPMDECPVGDFKLVLLRVPKQLSLLRYQLQTLRECLAAGTPVICGGMDKHLPAGVAEIISGFAGSTERHRGQRKARLFSTALEPALQAQESASEFFCAELGQTLTSLPNVFSATQLDGGTRLLLSCMEDMPQAERIIDLGCGNGVIGLAAMQCSQSAQLIFVDESAMAIASARLNTQRLFPERLARCEFRHTDGLIDFPAAAAQLILCNPPFHQQHAVDEQVGKRLLRQSATSLPQGGELWLVANRHLAYKSTLQRHFASLERRAEDPRFIVWRAVR